MLHRWVRYYVRYFGDKTLDSSVAEPVRKAENFGRIRISNMDPDHQRQIGNPLKYSENRSIIQRKIKTTDKIRMCGIPNF